MIARFRHLLLGHVVSFLSGYSSDYSLLANYPTPRRGGISRARTGSYATGINEHVCHSHVFAAPSLPVDAGYTVISDEEFKKDFMNPSKS